jgi:hypothetical protein
MTPSRTQSTRRVGAPLSNTLMPSSERVVVRNGSYSSPGAAGSQASVSGSAVSRSPTRPASALRPSCADRPSIDQAR